MNALRSEVPTIMAPHIAASITALRNEVEGSVTSALAELRQHSAGTAQQISDGVQTQFSQAATGFSEEQERVKVQLQAGQERITATQTIMEETLKTLQKNLDEAVQKLASVSDGKLSDIAEKLVSQEDKMIAYELQMTEHEANRKEKREGIAR